MKLGRPRCGSAASPTCRRSGPTSLAGIALSGGAVADARTLPLLVRALAVLRRRHVPERRLRRRDRRARAARAADPAGPGQRRDGVRGRLRHAGARPRACCSGLALGVAGGTGLGAGLRRRSRSARAIVLYDRHHKDNPLSPLLMGLCRVLVYVTAALAVAHDAAGAARTGAAAAALLPDRPDLRRQAGEPRRGPQPLAAAVPRRAGRLRARVAPHGAQSALLCVLLRRLDRRRALVPARGGAGRRAARGDQPDRRHLAARRAADRRRRRRSASPGWRSLGFVAHARPAALRGRHLSAIR